MEYPCTLFGEETKRLHFRKLSLADYNEWLPLFSKKEVPSFLGMPDNLTPNQYCDLWFKKSLARYEEKTGGMNVLIDKFTNHIVGQCGLLHKEIAGMEVTEIGYSILPAFWGKGYATEAAIKCKEYAFENNLATFLVSFIHQENLGSEYVAKKNGMTLFKHFPDYEGQPMNLFRVDK